MQEEGDVFEGSRPVGSKLDRRDFIRVLGGGIVVFFTVDLAAETLAQGGFRLPSYPADFNAYFRIGENGRVTVYSAKIEMGQGVITSLAQMAADELGVSLDSVDMIMGDTDLCPWDMGTFGSMSTRIFGPALRAAAAEARAVLLQLASEQLDIPVDRLVVENGVVFPKSERQRQVTFGQLTKGRKIVRTLDHKVPIKQVSRFNLIGKPLKRSDAVAKVTGKALYAGDIRVPDMLYARLLRPPAHGARLKHADLSAARSMPGVILVDQDGLIAALHTDPEATEKALAAIKADWEVPAPKVDDDTIFDYLIEKLPKAIPQPNDVQQAGTLPAGEKAASAIFERKYLCGYGAHAPIEPHTALAKMDGDRVTVWASTQTPFPDKDRIAKALALSPDRVHVIPAFVGGAFGGKDGNPMEIEAAKLAKIVGKPVQVAWNREEEFFYDIFRPAAVVKIKSGLDAAGRICLWDYLVYAAGTRSAEPFYDVPNSHIRAYGGWMGDSGNVHPFAIGPWRAPGANINVFGRESQIDIMAIGAKADPLEFRLNNTSDARMRRVLQAVAERFGWKRAVGPSGRGVGLACGIDAGTYVAGAAEVQVHKDRGAIKVKRVVVAQDMGIVVNPEGATMQIEGCITMGLGYTLSEDVLFQGGKLLNRNFDTYELPRFSQLPEIEAVLVKNDELAPQGGGEPAIILMGAMVANAVFDETGTRLFRLPMTPERVKAALASGKS